MIIGLFFPPNSLESRKRSQRMYCCSMLKNLFFLDCLYELYNDIMQTLCFVLLWIFWSACKGCIFSLLLRLRWHVPIGKDNKKMIQSLKTKTALRVESPNLLDHYCDLLISSVESFCSTLISTTNSCMEFYTLRFFLYRWLISHEWLNPWINLCNFSFHLWCCDWFTN